MSRAPPDVFLPAPVNDTMSTLEQLSSSAACTRRSAAPKRTVWRRRRCAQLTGALCDSRSPPTEPAPPGAIATTSNSSLWLVCNEAGAQLHAGPNATSTVLGHAPEGDVFEARLLDIACAWAKLEASEASRLLGSYDAGTAAYVYTSGAETSIRAFGGRDALSGELWFERALLGRVVQPHSRPKHAPLHVSASSSKRLKAMDGVKVDAAPPLRALETTLHADAIATLVDRGYVVVDHALPSALCRKLRAEMLALEANDQMWNSRSYGADDEGSAHKHIHETQLDYKDVRRFAPTFARIEHDPSLVDQLRGCVPGLEQVR